jgi:hypothetical protein
MHRYWRRSLESHSQITLDYYLPEARHYAWCKYAHQSHDWRMHLQLFLEEWCSSLGATIFTIVVSMAIVAQIVVMMVSSRSFGLEHPDRCTLWVTTWVLTAFFTVELILRTISKRTLAEMTLSAFWWIDVFSVVPDYVALIISIIAQQPINRCAADWGTMQRDGTLAELGEFLRIFRVVRILKIARLNPDTNVFVRAIQLSLRALAVPFTFVLLGAFFFGSILFHIEYIELVVLANVQDTYQAKLEISPFHDIGQAVWFMMVTFTGNGYGDVVPISHMGKAFTTLAMFSGIILLAMPLAIVGKNFSMAWDERTKMRFALKVHRRPVVTTLGDSLVVSTRLHPAHTHLSSFPMRSALVPGAAHRFSPSAPLPRFCCGARSRETRQSNSWNYACYSLLAPLTSRFLPHRPPQLTFSPTRAHRSSTSTSTATSRWPGSRS